jgi:hypothetical protein
LAVSALIVAFILAVLLIADFPEPISTGAGGPVYEAEDVRDLAVPLLACVGLVTVLPWLVAYLVAGRKRPAEVESGRPA